jgi:FPC/CPF motif-containing protein YcgG
MADNPFLSADRPPARSYHGIRNGRLVKLAPVEGPADPAAVMVHEGLRAVVLSETYPCLFSRSAVRRDSYRFGCYPALGSDEAAAAVAADLWQFVQDFPLSPDRFTTFIAAFDGPALGSEHDFEAALWAQLQGMHDLDRRHHRWDPAARSEPDRWGFSFSFAQRAFFIVGLHPAASRWARRTAWPTLVFNAREQFNMMRAAGVMDRTTEVIRRRDRLLQGTSNPSLAYFDAHRTEAVMYSGRLVEEDWRCPLRVRPGPGEATPRKEMS